MRSDRVKRCLLATLSDSWPYLMPESSLFAETQLRFGTETFSKIEFQTAMRELEAQKRILNQPDEDNRPKWKITDDGLARLKELGG